MKVIVNISLLVSYIENYVKSLHNKIIVSVKFLCKEALVVSSRQSSALSSYVLSNIKFVNFIVTV